MEASHNNHPIGHPHLRNSTEHLQNPPDFFGFLKADKGKSLLQSPPFFSKNCLSQDIIQVTKAEPDICLEVFYALYHTLWPQIEKKSDVSLKDAWTRFIGGAVFKGVLCPPEKLITDRRVRDIRRALSEPEGENQIFQDLDEVVKSISHLKQKILKSPAQILYKDEILASLSLACEFYLGFRNKMKALVQDIIANEHVSFVSQYDALEDLLEPKAIMMSDSLGQHWAYRISRNQARKLLSLDTNGRNLKSNSNDPSNHRVIALPEEVSEPLVFFKANGNLLIQPEKEFMLYSLYQHLQIPVPETALIILTDVFEANPEEFYAAQASEAVLGELALKAYRDTETVFDHEAYASQTIGAFLTDPSDGSFKNFKYSSEYKTFISIDNNLVFKPELIGPDDGKIANVKSMLYLLPEIDLPIPNSIKTFFTSLDPHLMILSWLQDLSQKNIEYNLLFAKLAFQKTRCCYQNLLPSSEVPPLATCLEEKVDVDPDLHNESPFCPKILVSQNILTTITEKLQIIEKALLDNPSINAQVLFEETSPFLGKYYRKLRFEFNDPEEAMEALWGIKKNDTDYSYISSLSDSEELISLSNKQNASDKNLIPETLFKEYKDLLVSGQNPLDRFIRRHSQRIKRNTLNLRATLKELQLLIQEGLTNSQSPQNVVDFCHILSKIVDRDRLLIKEMASLLSDLPGEELKWLFTLEKYFLRGDRSVPKSLVPSSINLVGALMKQRTFLLTESENHYLFDEQGNIRKSTSLTGRSNVMCFPEKNPEFYLKQYPEWPGYEFASTLFMRLLGIQHLPYQDLILVNSKYPVLLTQKVHGRPVLDIWQNFHAFIHLDPVHTGLLIISAMLINPEDGKEDNFILSPNKRYLIPIDNDHCFLPSTFQKEGSIWNAFTVNTALQTKTILFCLDEMYMPIPLEVKRQILSLDFDVLLVRWMTELDKIENQLNNLVDQNQRTKFLEQGTVMRIPFYKQFIETIYWKAHKIQEILKVSAQPTPFDLLTAVEPFSAKCYEKSFKKGHDLQSRFKAATDQLYTKTTINGSRVSILNTRNMMEIINVSEHDLQKDPAFQRMGPGDALELLNELIQKRIEKTKKEQEMLCELDEKNHAKKWMNLFGNSLIETDLKVFFTNPKEGLVLKGSKLISSSKLATFFLLTPDRGIRIRFLSLPESPSLTEKEIKILTEECPNLAYLNVCGCMKLTEIVTAQYKWPLLVRLEARDCLNLKKFVSHSPLKILRIGTDQESKISVENPTLDLFTFSVKTNQFDFSVKKGRYFQIKYEWETVSDSQIIRGIIHEGGVNKYLKNIKIGMSSISSEENLAVWITTLNLRGQDLSSEDLQKIILLKLINLKKLDLSANEKIGTGSFKYGAQWDWPLLEELNLSCCQITQNELNVIGKYGNLPKLKHLNLSGNEKIGSEGLEILVSSNWKLLECLILEKTGITDEGIQILASKSNWLSMKKLDISSNKIQDEGLKALSSGKWPLLEKLYLRNLKITDKGIASMASLSEWPNLKSLNLSGNGKVFDERPESLAFGKWPLLKRLNLCKICVSYKTLEILAKESSWPCLKKIHLSRGGFPQSDYYFTEVREILRKKWVSIKFTIDGTSDRWL